MLRTCSVTRRIASASKRVGSCTSRPSCFCSVCAHAKQLRISSSSVPQVRGVYSAAFPTEHFDKYKAPLTDGDKERRPFVYMAIGGVGVGIAALAKSTVVGVIENMSPSADVLAVSTVEVDLSTINEGSSVTVKWRGRPLFIRHRTPEEIEIANSVDVASLPDPQPDSARVIKPEWLVMVGVCTHLGCVPIGGLGDYNGWFCPCHGSHYDTSGRIRRGPAPLNLLVPPYKFVDEHRILVGAAAD